MSFENNMACNFNLPHRCSGWWLPCLAMKKVSTCTCRAIENLLLYFYLLDFDSTYLAEKSSRTEAGKVVKGERRRVYNPEMGRDRLKTI